MHQSNAADSALVAQILAGQPDVYRELMSRYEAPLLRYAGRLVGDPDDAADVVQEAFISAYRNLGTYDSKRPFSSWMYRIVRNRGYNWLRSRKNLIFGEAAWSLIDLVPSGSTPALEFEQTENKELLEKCLADVPFHYREPLILFYLEEQSYQEISEIMRLPLGTVGTRINRGRGLLKEIYTKHESKQERGHHGQ